MFARAHLICKSKPSNHSCYRNTFLWSDTVHQGITRKKLSPYLATMLTTCFLSLGVLSRQNLRSNAYFSNGSGCRRNLLKLETVHKCPDAFSVHYLNSTLWLGFRLTFLKEFIHIGEVIFKSIWTLVNSRSH